MIEGNEEEDDEIVESLEGSNKEIDAEDIEEYGQSLNELEESYAHNTIRIRGSYLGRDLVIFIDGESTHSFINECFVEEVKVMLKRTTTLAITVANGSVMK